MHVYSYCYTVRRQNIVCVGVNNTKPNDRKV